MLRSLLKRCKLRNLYIRAIGLKNYLHIEGVGLAVILLCFLILFIIRALLQVCRLCCLCIVLRVLNLVFNVVFACSYLLTVYIYF